VKEVKLVVENETGLHARPAKVFVNVAKKFASDIRVQHGAKRVNAKSLISMLTLGAERGAQIHITVEGADEDEALQALQTAVAEGLGEGPSVPAGAMPAGMPALPEAALPETALPETALAETAFAQGALPEESMIKGIAAAPGIAIGPLFHLRAADVAVAKDGFGGAAAEKARLQEAIDGACGELVALHGQMAKSAPAEAAIFEVHQELLDDPELVEEVYAGIDKGQNAAWAWQEAVTRRADLVAALDDALLAQRAADLRDVGRRVLRLLSGADGSSRLPDEAAIVLAHDLSPSDTAALRNTPVLGFCTAAGGPTAHAAIIARALRLPAVVGAGEGILGLDGGSMAILDGSKGTLLLDPDPQTLAAAQEAQRAWRAQQEAAARSASQQARTVDGHRVEVVANVGGVEDAREAAAGGAEGVGLLRTEFLFLRREQAPTVAEQQQVYSAIVGALQGQPVIIRTLDIGGDKPVPYIQVPAEANPFLGERGIRLCLARPDLLRAQVRAILQATSAGEVRIMFPMIADLGEWRRARALVEEERAALGIAPVEMGIMIEIPSAALMADAFAREVDFFSVGTNDLTQYTLAMDRMHPTLAGQSDGLHPAVLRLIKMTADAAHVHGKWLGVCGELGADPQAVPILVGLGVDELSVSVPAIARVKAQIRTLNLTEAQALAQKALGCEDARAVRRLEIGDWGLEIGD
jgi:phosphocarrier protein FPr